MKSITETEKAYLAGFFDGEGCVSISKAQPKNHRIPKYAMNVAVVQKGIKMLAGFQELTGIGNIYETKQAYSGYSWQFSGNTAKEFLVAILPYLINKKQQAELAIEFAEKYNRRTRIYSTGRKKVGGSMPTPQHIVDEKEQYRLLLHKLKGASGKSGRKPKNTQIVENNTMAYNNTYIE